MGFLIYFIFSPRVNPTWSRSSSIAAADGIADSCCTVFYNIIVDPLSGYLAATELFGNCNNNGKHGNSSNNIPCIGIPGRHNRQKARKRSRAIPTPFRRSCIRRIHLSTKPKETELIHEINSRDNSIVAIGVDVVRNSIIETCNDCFQEWAHLLQLCITYNHKMQEWLFSIFDSYLFVIPLILLSIVQRRSVTTDAKDSNVNANDSNVDAAAVNYNLHNFVFIGKPRSGNDTNNVHFSPPVERYLANRKVNITGNPKKCSAEYLVGDSGVECSVIANPALLTHIRKSKQPMNIHCNSGITTTTLIGHLKGFGWVWHDPQGIANIISLSKLATKHHVTIDTSIDNAIYVH